MRKGGKNGIKLQYGQENRAIHVYEAASNPPPPANPASPGWKPDSEQARGVNATAYEADQDFIYSP